MAPSELFDGAYNVSFEGRAMKVKKIAGNWEQGRSDLRQPSLTRDGSSQPRRVSSRWTLATQIERVSAVLFLSLSCASETLRLVLGLLLDRANITGKLEFCSARARGLRNPPVASLNHNRFMLHASPHPKATLPQTVRLHHFYGRGDCRLSELPEK